MRNAVIAAIAGALLGCGQTPTPPAGHAPKSMPEKTGSHGHDEEARKERAYHAQEHEEEAEALASADHRGRGHHKHHRFTNAAEWTAQFDSPERAAWQKPDEVVAALKLTPAMTVADLGAGTGYFTVLLARAVPQGKVVANDLEPDMVKWIGERAVKEGLGNVVTVAGAATDPKLPEGLDVALMVDTYHHIDEPSQFFGKVRDALKPGGLLVIVDFKKDAPEDAPGPPAAMRVDDAIVAAHLQKLGFTHERTDRELLPYQYLVFMRKPG
ncbi:class I SAM-dependent methyltransferase [Nannocystis radixulma]|uniref:Class I SAM-dependent methyltransferase n=1 Tax=Nannocystis radixulma TaxID=2995305 RepID=A0ABT5B9N2_9BACT|nr:class I SAM-dependent methyltransferase [Nannocystis radixulma]MDC0670850.1 class I SAM-dependent methyltransferase [Nannocystis radixulma]